MELTPFLALGGNKSFFERGRKSKNPGGVKEEVEKKLGGLATMQYNAPTPRGIGSTTNNHIRRQAKKEFGVLVALTISTSISIRVFPL